MKKIICVAITLMLMAACVVTAMAAPAITMSVATVDAAAGKTVEVPVTVPAIDFGTFQFTLKYDASVLTFVEFKQGEYGTGMWTYGYEVDDATNEGAATIGYVFSANRDNRNTHCEGVLFTAIFNVAENAAPGEYPIVVDTSVTNNITDGYTYEKYDITYEDGAVVIPCTHNWGEWEVTTPATCIKDGTEARTCAICGEIETRAIPSIDHTWGEWTVGQASTCAVKGYQVRTCSVCNETQKEDLPLAEHTWGEWTETVAPTCTEKGVATRECSVCGEKETKAIDALGHDFDTKTYKYDDEAHWHICQRCGAESEHVAHTWDNKVEEVAPTKTESGYTIYSCVCGHEKKTTTPPTGDAIILSAVAALAVIAGAAFVTMKRK